MRFVNLTGHPLTISIGSRQVKLPVAGRVRINSEVRELEKLDFEGMKVPLLHLNERSIVGLPDPEDGVMYIVSGIVATAANRDDVVAPSRIVREENGRVTECKAVIRPAPMRMDKETE